MHKYFREALFLLESEHKKKLIYLFFLISLGLVLEMLGLGIIIPIVTILTKKEYLFNNELFNSLYLYFDSPSYINIISFLLFLLFALYVIKNIFLFYINWYKYKFTYKVRCDLADKLFKIYLSQSYMFFINHNSATLIRNTEEVNIYSDNLNQLIILLSELLLLLLIVALLLYTAPIEALSVSLVVFVFSYIFNKITKKKLNYWGRERQIHDGLKTQHLKQGIEAHKEIKIMGRLFEFWNIFSYHNHKDANSARYLETYLASPKLWLETIAVLALVLTLLISLNKNINFNDFLPILGLFAVSAFKLIPAINKILNSIQFLNFYLPVNKNLFKEFNLSSYSLNMNKLKKISFKDSIKINSIDFKFPDTKNKIFDSLSLEIFKNDYIGIIGSSGSGKSTLINIILGLLVSDKGSIFVDKENIKDRIADWRNNLGYVPQSVYLIDDNIKRNIAFGLPELAIDEKKVIRSLKEAQIYEFIKTLPNGLNSIVGEKGVKLSGGQIQRIGIARALYENPEILIFDEATSSLDSITENNLLNEFRGFLGNRTVIFITHRLSSLKNCNKVFKLENGKLIQIENIIN